MTTFMLDTNTVSYALRGVPAVVNQLKHRKPNDLCISAVTLAELRYGAEKRQSAQLTRLIDTILLALSVRPFDEAAAQSYGHVAAALARAGSPIGLLDTQIAAHALAIGATIVTSNTKHFRRVAGLHVVDWS